MIRWTFFFDGENSLQTEWMSEKEAEGVFYAISAADCYLIPVKGPKGNLFLNKALIKIISREVQAENDAVGTEQAT